MKYERRRISDLKPDPNNPRTISKQAKRALATSIRRFGLVQPVIVNETTGHVVGGHQRLDVLREQGVTEIDVVIGAWSIEEERALNVALNNPAGQGKFTDVGGYLDGALRTLSLDDFKALQLDKLVLANSNDKERKEARELEYKLVIAARDEAHQAELLERLEAEGLDVKLLIV